MRVLPVLCLTSLGALSLAGCVGTDRNEGFTATSPTSFLYSARTSTVMTENDDGEAERIRQGWLVAALKAHAMCDNGFVVDTRRFVPEPGTASGPQFGNGGEIVYSGRCIVPSAPPAPVAPPPAVPPVRG
ncbi:MAG TPA: hypothetical protein VNV38_15245 [Stellaceae bacterium]|jgi:hypothetical protein|nr:hypothetical protein [Stellaceae bacterium]